MKKNRGKWSIPILVFIFGIALQSFPAEAGELTKFTGYTRPGIPNAPPGAIKVAGDKVDEAAIGATVYFKVFERMDGEESDPWGSGFKNLAHYFMPGEASRGKNATKLDTSARYLYLYQVVNDSYRPARINSVAVRLLVPPHLITSWGYFAEKGEKDTGRGIGFGMIFDNPDLKNAKAPARVLPLSTDHPGVTDNLYRNPAPYFFPPKRYSLSHIQLRNKPAALTDGEDTGREPERVILQSSYKFEGAPNWLIKDQVRLPLSPFTRLSLPSSSLDNPYYNPANPFLQAGTTVPGMGSLMPGMTTASASTSLDVLRRAPAVVAYWDNDPLQPGVAGEHPGQRSTIFGFTSNFPPVYEDVRVRGNSTPAGNAPADPSANAPGVAPGPDGEVPTPVALEQGIPPLGHAPGSFGGPIGEIGGGSLLRGGGGFGGGGFGFGFPFGGGGVGGGGGFGGGSGGGGTAATPSNGALLALLANPFATNGNQSQAVNLNVSQSQSMAQAQAQLQAQGQLQLQLQSQSQSQCGHHGHHGHVVPEPTALLSAALGLPCLLFLIWRSRRPIPAAV